MSIIDKDVYMSMEKLLEELENCHACKNFIENIVNVYEERKHNTFYTKGIIYDSVDRILSNNVIKSVLSGRSTLVEESNTSARVYIHDEYLTSFSFYLENGQFLIDMSAMGVCNPKVNKKAMEILAASLYERLAK